MTTPIEDRLRENLAAHSARYSPIYRGYLSDHGPMTALALHGLGGPDEETARWLDNYCKHLEPLDDAPDLYEQLLMETKAELKQLGRDALLQKSLPDLISGWPTSAYHPLIRLAYGYQFGIDEEVAAGLACLKLCGPRPELEQLARTMLAWKSRESGEETDPLTLFRAMADCATTVVAGRRFDDCLDLVELHPAFQSAAIQLGGPLFGERELTRQAEPLQQISRLALQAFDQSHDFFALHLVTGAHAYRILYPFAGPLRDPILALGILAGYACVGAPAFDWQEEATAPVSADLQRRLRAQALSHDDEHDLKIAFSCVSQTEHFGDPGYTEVAFRYLLSR